MGDINVRGFLFLQLVS